MKKFYFYMLLLFVSAACQREAARDEGGEGWLAVDFFTDKSVQSRSDGAVYALSILKPDGSVVASYDDVSSISDRILLKSGSYKLVATHGRDVAAGFDAPFYRAEQDVRIEAAVTKEVAMVCTQANVKVSVAYSKMIQDHFPNYSLEVTNGDGELVFVKDESRAGFLKVNKSGSMVWNLTLDNGQERFELTKTITGVAARQHYRFSFDVKESGDESEGAFVPGITVDTTTDVFNWVCDVVLKETIAKPEIKGDGFDLGGTVLVLDEARGANARLNVTALAKIQELKVWHRSPEAKALGLPESVTISNLSQAEKEAVNAAGVTWGNEAVLDAQGVTVDFSGLLDRLPLGNYDFGISVYDARKRLVADTLHVSVIPDMDHIAVDMPRYEIWTKHARLGGVWYTLERPAGLGLEYSTDRTNWVRVADGDLTFDEATKSVSGVVGGLTPSTVYYVRTVSDVFVSDEPKVFTTEAVYQFPYLNFDKWFKSGKTWYLGESSNKLWDSGNEGANTMSEKNPTAPDYSDKVAVEGNEASAKLETKVVFGVMAAGNIYTGDFVKAVVDLNNPGAQLEFGQPYAYRPTSLTGYYKYQPVGITQSSRPNVKKGDLDSCHVYVALFADWTEAFKVNTQTGRFVNLKEAIAFGELKDSRTMSGFEKFTFEIKYRDRTKIPTYILIVASSSKYGDYFTGGEGSKLWLDEFELGFD